MVDASSLFIVYEFFMQYLPSFLGVEASAYGIFIWSGTALLMLALGVLLKHFSNRAVAVIRALAYIVAVISLFFLIATVFQQYHVIVENWAYDTFGIDPALFYAAALLILSGTSAVICILISFSRDKEPNNDSTLNARQKLQAYSVFAIIIFVGSCLWFLSYDVFSTVVLLVIFFAELMSILFWFYDPIIYIISKLLHRKAKTALAPTPGRVNRFAILACAHNEEKVIGHLIDSLYAMTYPKGKYDVFVLCDNCDDGTAQVAQQRGAIAMERFDTASKGKGNALKWMFKILDEMREVGDEYDAYIVLDADNLVNAQYLSEINKHLNQGHEIMQTYLGCKNPNDTWISKCYSMAYWLSNANYQDAHSKLNLTAQMGGTGMVLRPDMLQELQWESDSLTEDLVLTAKYVLRKNKACHWVHTARLYDEKPLVLKPSMKQRTRWMQGHMDAMIRYAPKLLLSGIKTLSLKQLDMAFYLCRPFFNLLSFIVYLVRIVAITLFPGGLASLSFIMNFETATTLMLFYILIQVYILNTENYLRYAIWIPLQYVFTYTWYIPIFRGLMKYRERFWVSTIHGRDLTIGDIREDVLIAEARKRLAGLDNLHLLPLGQILLKAAVVTGDQLQAALAVQKKTGGFLGNVLVEIGAVSEETLNAYVNIQQVMRETAEGDSSQLQKLQLGQILLDANVITEQQLNEALDYQQINGGRLGENLVKLRFISADIIGIFLEVQDLIGANYLNTDKAHDLVKGMVQLDKPDQKMEILLLSSGLISQSQLETAQEYQKEQKVDLIGALLQLGFVSEDALETIKNAMTVKAHAEDSLRGGN